MEVGGGIGQWTVDAFACMQCGLVCGVDAVCGDANMRARRGLCKRLKKSK